MGRKEAPIASSHRTLVTLVRWLRAQRAASGCSYAELAARVECHATTLQRAASGRSVPSERAVRAYALACRAPVDEAMELWRQARRRSPHGPESALTASDIDGIDMFRAGLRELYERAGRPSVRAMEQRAGPERLPHSTAHRIVQGRTVPRDAHQLTGFLTACEVAAAEYPSWIDAWQRAVGQSASRSPLAEPSNSTVRSVGARLSAPSPTVPSSGLYFSLLGPVRAWYAGQPLMLGSPQQQALLAALLLREGRTATAGQLIDALWGDEPPAQALAALRTYASRLRKVLPAATLVSESGGYALRVPSQALDVATARHLAEQVEKARARGDVSQACLLVQQALDLWQGEILANIPGPYAETQRTRLEEWRLQLYESRLDMDLACGRHTEVVTELTELTAAHPLRERLRELLMMALYRGGRQAEALAVYADTRRLLADELGVDPRPALSDLQQRILRADPALLAPEMFRDVEAAAAMGIRPAQLPLGIPDFAGRAAVAAELAGVLSAATRGSMPLIAVSGVGGVGKTTLAVHVGQAVQRYFPDGQLYIDLQQTEPAAALGAALRALGVAEQAVPEDVAERSALYRSVLHGRRVLVVLDDARNAAQVRWLLPATEGCGVLVASRRRMPDLVGAHLVELDVLSPDEALQFAARIAGEQRIADERTAAQYVVAACGFLPLAIRIAASRLAARRAWAVADLAEKLADEGRRLEELQAGDLVVKSAFARSYGLLDAEQARAFLLLSASTNPFLSLAEAAEILHRSLAAAETLLENLVDAGLLSPAGPAHYQMHPLVRLFAKTLSAP